MLQDLVGDGGEGDRSDILKCTQRMRFNRHVSVLFVSHVTIFIPKEIGINEESRSPRRKTSARFT